VKNIVTVQSRDVVSNRQLLVLLCAISLSGRMMKG